MCRFLFGDLFQEDQRNVFFGAQVTKCGIELEGEEHFFLLQRKASVLVSPILAASATTSLVETLAFMCLAAFTVGAAFKSWTGKA